MDAPALHTIDQDSVRKAGCVGVPLADKRPTQRRRSGAHRRAAQLHLRRELAQVRAAQEQIAAALVGVQSLLERVLLCDVDDGIAHTPTVPVPVPAAQPLPAGTVPGPPLPGDALNPQCTAISVAPSPRMVSPHVRVVPATQLPAAGARPAPPPHCAAHHLRTRPQQRYSCGSLPAWPVGGVSAVCSRADATPPLPVARRASVDGVPLMMTRT